MKNSYILLVFFLFSYSFYGQKSQVAKADKKYDKMEYIDAIEIYERVANKGFVDADVYKKIANAYYFNADLKTAAAWYEKLFKSDVIIDSDYYFRYSQSLKSLGLYDEAAKMLDKFHQLNKNDTRGVKYESNKDYLKDIQLNSGRFKIENISTINSKYSDYGAAFFGEFIVFTSARDTGAIANRKHKWTNKSFTNLYQANVLKNGSFVEPQLFSKEIQSIFNESTPVFTKDGKTIYFTRNNYKNKRKGKNSEQTTLLKIYKATFEDGKWGNEIELPFNNDQYSVAHPALSPDEKTLFFASDMPGTIGLSDIFKVPILDSGNYGTPVNLGNSINTEGRESFPFVSSDNDLYFASDGHLGLGGFDVFNISLENTITVSTEVINVGSPINSNDDDFAFIIDVETKTGFFSSNRAGGKGEDDIYKFVELKPLIKNCQQTLVGIAFDEDYSVPISNAQISLLDLDNAVLEQINADENGKFTFNVACNKEYIVRVTGFDSDFFGEKLVKTSEISEKVTIEIPVKQTKVKIVKGVDLAIPFGIQNIFFDLDKSTIRNDAIPKLALILEVLKEHPNMKIDVRSHTDCRQTYDYNMKLSDQRAKSTISWLVTNGIHSNRLTGKGYGESQLKNDCNCEPTNESSCSEQEHQQNRRSEFIIVE